MNSVIQRAHFNSSLLVKLAEIVLNTPSNTQLLYHVYVCSCTIIHSKKQRHRIKKKQTIHCSTLKSTVIHYNGLAYRLELSEQSKIY